MALTITSPAFKEGDSIPKRFSCQGANVSPLIGWEGAPQGTRSYALIADDPDAAGGTWVHWVIFNIPGAAAGLSEGVPVRKTLEDGSRQGTNDFRKIGYGGPCPPPGNVHRYFFKIYALDRLLELEAGATKAQLEQAMRGHILAEGRLMGKFRH